MTIENSSQFFYFYKESEKLPTKENTVLLIYKGTL